MNTLTLRRGLTLLALGSIIAACSTRPHRNAAPIASSTPATAPDTQPDGNDITLTSPMNMQIFQRTSPSAGPVLIQGQIDAPAGTVINLEVATAYTRWQIPAAITKPHPDTFGQPTPANQEITEIPLTLGEGGAFSASVLLPAGGWHALVVTANSTTETFSLKGHTRYVGVGEVFVVGGQSNSTNYGEVKTKSTTGYVTVFDGKEWTAAADGSPWCIFGDLMAEKYHMPIGIVPVGRGATSVRQWLPNGDIVTIEPTRTAGLQKLSDGRWQSEGQLYDRMVARMKSLGVGGFRAMLWHQGESDAHQANGHTLPGTDYTTDLERVIIQSRKDLGWNVPWFVAQATWNSPQSPADPDIRAAQKKVVDDGVAYLGADTDTLLGENRQKDGAGVHMSEIGLHNHAKLWVDAVGKVLDAP